MNKTYILIMDIEIYLPYSLSLKDKRQVRRSIVDRFRARHNVSIAESAKQEDRKNLALTLAYVAISESTALEQKEKLTEELYSLVDEVQGQVSVSFDIV